MVEVYTPEKTDIALEDICYPDNPISLKPHHWAIETPQAETSPGECKNCHITRVFRNSQHGKLWEDPVAKNSWGRYKPGQTECEDNE